PKIATHSDGMVSIAWYDFGLDGNIADLFLKTSDPAGVFDLGETLPQMRITNKNDRGGIGSYSVPDLAVDLDGNHHLCWVSGLGAAADLFYAEAIEGGTTVNGTLLQPGATDFFDPPHITVSEEGDVWIAYADEALKGIGDEDIVILRRRAGQPGFDTATPVLTDSAREYGPDIEIDSKGFVHLVWVDERSGTHVYHGIFEPENLTLLSEVKLTETDGNWERPSILLDDRDQVYVLWEEEIGFNSGAIWFSTDAAEPSSRVGNWNLYD
ncbi:MAG: hypothetical protein KC978_21315, partial [Candidatus Omnitrophica bacterium]|nr:hypothetical protein [Candidatus Omnitrophota bacterium]